ncbi:MAG: hydrolase [Deltaproteobacteria bacterium HGW-Deltaproteobacteria-8]|jgi:kynurenine formamidase|nr:MAG: hydrolase [Deltaproteobacteria bacterium HGW-Deltaproteobacteria-8]
MRAPKHILDLSWPVSPGMPLFPGDPPVTLAPMGVLETDGFLSHLAGLPAHSGTHVDAPAHVLADGEALCDLPLSRFAGPGVVLDVRDRAGLAVQGQDLEPHLVWLRAQAPAFVLLLTGDAARWGEADYFTRGAHLTPEAALLLAGLGLSGIGLDAASVDPYETSDQHEAGCATGTCQLPAHRLLLGAGLVIVENLCGLDRLPASGFEFLCLPVLGLDGSPVRAAALLPGGVS